MSETSPRQKGDQDRNRWTAADLLSAARIPLAVAFPLASDRWRMVILALAAGTDLLDGPLARRYGSSPLGSLIDPVADKLFMAAAFGVVAVSDRVEKEFERMRLSALLIQRQERASAPPDGETPDPR